MDVAQWITNASRPPIAAVCPGYVAKYVGFLGPADRDENWDRSK